ncbi:MAG: DUF3987 domain-containing protein [Gemmataceae bacterium]|nr:DUF3987 domain-containing protein [Gemmataceae bacterium]
MNATPIDKVLSAIGDYKRSGKSYQARCPAHEDTSAGLSISAGEDGTVLVKCHSGCNAEAVVTALGLTMRDLFPRVDADTTPRNSQKNGVLSTAKRNSKTFATAAEAVADLEKRYGKRSGLWTYHDAVGHPVGVVVRWPKPGGKKDIRPVAKSGAGWMHAGMTAPRPLYRLPELLQSTRPVYVTEGEKKADALRDLGFTVTTSAHGAQSANGTDWKALAGREVVILPDNDIPGAKYANDVIDLLYALTPRPSIKVVNLPNLSGHGDVVDYIAHRRATGMDNSAIRSEIQTLADKAEVVQKEVPEPELAYQPFPVHLLPDPIRGYITASAAAIGCDPAFIALPMLAAVALAIGSRRRIRLKRRWTEPAIIWALTIALSGSHKSPGFDAAMLPVKKRQDKAKRRLAEDMRRYALEMEEYNSAYEEWKAAGCEESEPREPREPTLERTWTDNTTMEALACPILKENPRGVLLACDELSAWFGSFDRYAKGGAKSGADAARWMHLHGGRSFVIDRKTGIPPTVFVKDGTVGVAGSIQPGVLRRMMTTEHHESGMAARFLLSMPPKKQKRWTEAEIDEQLEQDVLVLFDRLYDLQPDHDEDGEPTARLLKLSQSAKHDVWIPFYNEHAKEQIELDEDLSAAWSKLEGYAARLALVHHLIRVAADDGSVNDPDIVDDVSMTAGIALSRWFGQEAKRVYTMLATTDEDQAERELIELIERLGGTVTARELQRRSRKYPTAKDAEKALCMLVDRKKGAWQTKPGTAQGGRPTSVFVLHPVDTTPAKPNENGGSVNVDGKDQAGEWGAV